MLRRQPPHAEHSDSFTGNANKKREWFSARAFHVPVNYSPLNGNSAITRARLIAVASSR